MIKFGVFTDTHYAKNVKNGNRNCDLSLARVRNIVNDFNVKKLDFCACLGDVINSVRDYEKDLLNIQLLSAEFNNFNMPYHILLGNHDLEAMSKTSFYTAFNKQLKKPYYSFSLDNSRFIVLDANHLLDNSEYCCGNYKWDESYINKEQLIWLENQLSLCDETNIIIFTHQNLDHRMKNGELDACIIKNYKDVTKILEKSKKGITVIQGHYHDGYYQVINGITYITIKALCVGDDISYIPRIIVTVDDEISIEYLE